MNADFLETASRVHDHLRAHLALTLGVRAIESDDSGPRNSRSLGSRIRAIVPENLESVSAFGTERLAALTGAHAALLSLADIDSWQLDPLEVLASSVGTHLATRICSRPHPGAPRAGTVSAHTVTRCVDGYALLSAPTPEDALHLARMIGLTPPGEVTDEALRAWAAPQLAADLVETAQAWRLPVLARLADTRAHELQDCSPFKLLASDTRSRVRPQDPGPRPLSGVKVLELGGMWAGPLCGRLLAALGADVIKVEGPTRPDGTRPVNPQTCWGTFADFNRGKRGLVVDMATQHGRERLAEVIETVDIVVENFSPRVLPNWGLTYDALHGSNPDLLMVSLPAFPRDTAQAHYTAYGPALEFASGLAATDGHGEAAPAPSPIAFVDYLAGLAGAIAVLGSLRARARCGWVGHIEVAQFAVARTYASILEPETSSLMNLDCLAALERPSLRASGLLAEQATASGTPCVHLARPPWHIENWTWSTELPAPAFEVGTGTAPPDVVTV